MIERFGYFIEGILIKAGWFNGRRVQHLVSNWRTELHSTDKIEMFPEAEAILVEFGGIKVERKEKLSKQSFEINPSLVRGEGDRLEKFSNLIGVKLYPLGEALSGYYFLAVAEDGRVFWVMEDIFTMGNSFDEALTKMILDYQPAPLEIHQ